MIFDSVVDAIGHTPLVRLRLPDTPDVEVYAKLELQNLFAMKDRVARNVVLEARRVGVLRPGDPIVESSSGTMALGLALVGTALGHPVHIVTDPRIDAVTLAKLRALGCEVHVVEQMSAHGWQSARLERLQELLATLPGAFFPQQYRNPDNPGAYAALAGELVADLGTLDVLVGSVGSGGSLCGTGRALRRHLPHLRVVGVDSVGSVLFGQPDVPGRLQSGLGNSLHPANLDRRVIDEVHWLNDREAFDATRDLAREQQLFAGNTSGSVYRVLRDVARRAAPGTRIVGILPDRGDRYVDTVYSDAWAADRLATLPVSERSEPIPAGRTATGWSRTDQVADPQLPQHLIFVESNTTGSGMLALRTARALGLVPVLLTDDPGRYAGLGDVDCVVVTCATGDVAALRALIQDRWRREELVGITTTSDFYTVVAADLAGWLGLPGNPVDAVASCRDKGRLRDALTAAGLAQPRYVKLTDPAGVAAAVAAVGLPCVVKPADDSGSNLVRLCATVAEATAQAQAVLAVTHNVRGLPTAGYALVEEYLDGPEVSVEMFGDGTGTHCLGITAKRVTGQPWFVEHGHVFPADLPGRLTDEVADTVRRALAAVGMCHGATHTEVRLTTRGPAVVEINPRPAGGMIPELYRLATGSDLLVAQVRAAAGRTVELSGTAGRYAAIAFLLADRAGTLREVAGVDEAAAVDGVHQVTVTARVGATVRPPRNAYDRLGYVIASGATRDEALDALTAATVRLRPVLAGDGGDGGDRAGGPLLTAAYHGE